MSSSALDADVIARIDDLEVAARLVVEGLRAGGHRSPLHGYSAEFQQHRPYRAGDDLKYLDWKLLARTDRLYSKQFRETTSMSVMLVLDASASMDFPTGESAISKFRYGQIVAASLAYLISAQGDAVGLMTTSDGRLTYLPARGGRLHLRSLIATIDRLDARGTWQPDRVLARGAELLDRRGLVIAISDFYDAEDDTQREMRRVRRRGHDVSMLQVLSAAERDFPFAGDVEFEDAESGERRLVNAASAGEAYRRLMAAFVERCRTAARREGLDHALLLTSDPPSQALRGYLLRRGSAPGANARHLSGSAASAR